MECRRGNGSISIQTKQRELKGKCPTDPTLGIWFEIRGEEREARYIEVPSK